MFTILTLILSGQTLAQNILGKFGDLDVSEYSVTNNTKNKIQNVSAQPFYIVEDKKSLDVKEANNLDVSWQSLVEDTSVEPIVQDLKRRRINKSVRIEADNNTEHTNKVTSFIDNYSENSKISTDNYTENINIVKTDNKYKNPNITTTKTEITTKNDNRIAEKPNENKTDKLSKKDVMENLVDIEIEDNEYVHGYYNATQTSASYITTEPNADFSYKSNFNRPKITIPHIQTQDKWNDSQWGGRNYNTKEEEAIKKEYIRVYEEILNSSTTCEEFLNNTVFDPEKVLNIDWHSIYYWNSREEEPYNMRFTKPSDMMIKQFKTHLDSEIKPPVNWSNAELFMETNLRFDALFIKTNVSGLYLAIPTEMFDYVGVPMMYFGIKTVNDYLGIVNCRVKQCYAFCDNEKRPNVDEVDKVAQSIGFYSIINSSYTRMNIDLKGYKEMEDRDQNSMEDNLMNEFDSLNVDPMDMEIF